MAVAAEQEQSPEIEQSRAKLVEAEAEVPKAWPTRSAAAGWVSWIIKLRNVQADTDMRRAIAGVGGGTAGQATRQ
jgi:uncharacterized protein YqfA (UPF0365 family)